MSDDNNYKIDLDIWKQFPIKKISVKQLDIGRKINIYLYSNGYKYNLDNCAVTIYIKKNKKSVVFNDCKIVGSNVVEMEITEAITEVSGEYTVEVDILSDGISAFNFILNVVETTKDAMVVTQTSEYKALVNMAKKIENFSGRIDDCVNELGNKVDLEYVKTYPIVEEEEEALLLTDLSKKDMNLKYEYGHINRYGAKELGKDEFDVLYNKTYNEEDLDDWDSSRAIQTAVYVVEKLATNRKGIYPVKFGGGTYLVTHTIICKSCINDSSEIGNYNNPLSFIGVERKTISSGWNTGTLIIPMIENTNYVNGSETEGYANLFAINIKYQSKSKYIAPINDENEIGKPYMNLTEEELYDTNYSFYGMGTNATICDNVTFKNLSFYLDNNISDDYNINVIKAYRTRFTIDNVYAHNMRQFMLQPPMDATGGSSYCDFSQYTNINFGRLKYRGLELYNPDNSKIEDVTNHFPGKNFDCLILIREGGGITISRIHFAYSFDLDIKKEQNKLVPKQLGTGKRGSKAYIKLANTRGVNINGVYGERQLLDYMFYLYNAKNVHIENTTESFFGNGYIRIISDSSNIFINNVYRKCNLVNDYVDIYFGDDTDVNNIKITNFIGEDWYKENISLETPQGNFANLTRVESIKKRYITCDKLNNTKSNKFSLESLTFKVVNVDGKLAILDYANNITSYNTSTTTSAKNDYFSVDWDNSSEMGGFLIEPTENIPFSVKSITPVYATIGSIYLPVSSMNEDRYRVAFWDMKESKYMPKINPNIGFVINIEALRM